MIKRRGFQRFLFPVILLFLLTAGCFSSVAFSKANKRLLISTGQDRELAASLESIGEKVFSSRWKEKFDLRCPKFRKEYMWVMWLDIRTGKDHKEKSLNRYRSQFERLGLSYLVQHSGPIDPDDMIKGPDYPVFLKDLEAYLTVQDFDESLLETASASAGKCLAAFGVDPEMAEENASRYRLELFNSAGFYLGVPIYRRLTLDDEIRSRAELLSVYFHESGHFFFAKHRSVSKSLSMGVAWMGWKKAMYDWWMIEEKSCNVIAEEALKEYYRILNPEELEAFRDFEENVNEEDPYKGFAPDFRKRYAMLFKDPKIADGLLSQKKTMKKYDTSDRTGGLIRKAMVRLGLTDYIRKINRCRSRQEIEELLNDLNEK